MGRNPWDFLIIIFLIRENRNIKLWWLHVYTLFSFLYRKYTLQYMPCIAYIAQYQHSIFVWFITENNVPWRRITVCILMVWCEIKSLANALKVRHLCVKPSICIKKISSTRDRHINPQYTISICSFVAVSTVLSGVINSWDVVTPDIPFTDMV